MIYFLEEFGQSNVNGYVLAFFAALVTGIVFTKDEKAYGEALVYGLSKPMFAVIVMAVITGYGRRSKA